jgi:hypothetical protein
LFVVLPVVDTFTHHQARIEQERTVQGRLRAALAEMAGTKVEDTSQSNAGRFLSGESEAIVAANLQSLLTEYASTNGVKLRSTRSLPARDRDGMRLIGVQMQFSGQMDAVQKLIYQIESAEPSLVVDAMSINGFAQRFGVATDGTSLEVRLDVFGAVLRAKG